MKRFVLITAIAAAATCQPQPAADAAPAVEITDLTCRPTPNGRDVTACFATFTSTTDDRLVAISSPNADEVQIHSVRTDNGLMVMREMEGGLVLPAGETIRLRPGGDHIMVIGAHTPLSEGDLLSLVLTFERAPQLGLRAEVGQPPLEGEGGGHH
jgi:copper(I)-binding protein